MNIKKYLGIASITLSLAIGLIAFLLVPKNLWNHPSILAFLIFNILSAYSFYSIVDSFGGKKGDASIIGLFAPSGLAHLVLILWSILTIFYCFQSDTKLEREWAMNVATITGAILTYLCFRASAKVIDDVVSTDESKKKIVSWQTKLKFLRMVIKDESLKVKLELIEEKIKFSGFNPKNSSSEFDILIDLSVQELENYLQNIDFQVTDDLKKVLDRLEINIGLRDSEING